MRECSICHRVCVEPQPTIQQWEAGHTFYYDDMPLDDLLTIFFDFIADQDNIREEAVKAFFDVYPE